ncbi:MAG TPA: 2Fe-2S iron-sulfur cluster-binding protein [Xanthobacteraceae bacterium]|nr:2Fe-2S iron-sulfur cluster-binding protein [Xanthobacteraceae bacterium]
MTSLTLNVNGVEVRREVAPRLHLADFVRDELGLTGTHIGCEHGVCGACTVIVDGRPVRACLSYTVCCAGSDVRTIESFDDDPLMDMLRRAFSRHHALQCGYCTPGMLATAYDIVTRLPHADEARIREELSGNLCRCTGYIGIVAAIRDVLSHGPHRSAVPIVDRAALAAGTLAPIVMAPQAEGTAVTLPADELRVPQAIEGGTSLTRTITVPVPVERLWATLQDVETVARCVPGASIEAILPDGTIEGTLQVTIGPMRARFRGAARLSLDAAALRGEVRGSGGDYISRSRAQGVIGFAARSGSGANSELALTMTYKLGGPLAQFGRPVIVETVVDHLLSEVAANLVRASRGGPVSPAKAVGGVGLAARTLLAMLRRLLGWQK